MAKHRCRIGIDVGGTFTDFVLANMATGELTRYKEPSVPADPSKSVERGLPPLMTFPGVAIVLIASLVIQRGAIEIGPTR